MPSHAQDPAQDSSQDSSHDSSQDLPQQDERQTREKSQSPSQSQSQSPSDAEQPVIVSMVDDKDRHDIRLQQLIDHLARDSEGRPHADVVDDLVERIAAADLGPMPQTWLDAVAAAAIEGNAYVVSRTAAALSDVPQPETRARQENIT